MKKNNKFRKKKKSNAKVDNEKDKSRTLNSKENLRSILDQYQNILNYSAARSSRLFNLLSRDSTKKLSKEKKERLIKRHLSAEEELSFAMSTVDQAEFMISQLIDEKK